MLISPLRSSSCSRWRPPQPSLLLLLHPEHFSSPFPSLPSPRPFSDSSPCSSRTGATPISVPTEVHLRLLPPKARKVITRIQPNQVLEVEGPLGGFFVPRFFFWRDWRIWKRSERSRGRKSKLTFVIWCLGKTSLEFPAYMDFAQDHNTGKALLKIPDRTVRKHREMWGSFCPE